MVVKEANKSIFHSEPHHVMSLLGNDILVSEVKDWI
jgi:hypothetical protein